MTNHRPLPPIERLSELLEIVPIDPYQFGFQSGLVWKVNRGTRGRAGSVAGSKKPCPRKPGRFDWTVKVDGRLYMASRVIYFMANGVDPGELEVDHEDQNSLNNNVGNLRLGGRSLQTHNRGTQSNNTSGAVGVTWDKSGKWQAQLKHKGERFYLGVHTCKIDAARVVNDKIIELKLDKLGKPLNVLGALECECCECQPNKRKRLFATSLAASLL